MMSIKENLQHIRQTIPEKVKLVAVSKTKPISDLQEAYDAGQRVFGENKVQEMASKYPALPKDIEWHFIGHLQSNKVKYIAPFVSLIHGVDSFKLLKEINRQAARNKRVIDCLLQFHIAKEATKFGLAPEEAEQILGMDEFSTLENIRITGVMGMSTFTTDFDQVRGEFRTLVSIFNSLKEHSALDKKVFKEISMGMSGDYQIAVEEGSTMVRVGTLIFGERSYPH